MTEPLSIRQLEGIAALLEIREANFDDTLLNDIWTRIKVGQSSSRREICIATMRIAGLLVNRFSPAQSVDLFNTIVVNSFVDPPAIAVFVRTINVEVLNFEQLKIATGLLASDRMFPVDFKRFAMQLARTGASVDALKFFAKGLSEPGYYVKSECLAALDEMVDVILSEKVGQIWAVVTAIYFASVDLPGDLRERAGNICRRLLGENQKAFAEAYYGAVGALAREIKENIGQPQPV
jgi:hypothetical protein